MNSVDFSCFLATFFVLKSHLHPHSIFTSNMVALRAISRFPPLSNRLAFSRSPQRALATIKPQPFLFSPLDAFAERHIGPDDHETSVMLEALGYASMDAFIDKTVPPRIRVSPESLDNNSIPVLSESQLHAKAQALGGQNKRFKSYIGMGYYSAVVPSVILRNVCSSLFMSSFYLNHIPGHGESSLVYSLYPLST